MSKITIEDKIYYCQQYLAGKMTQGQIASIAHVNSMYGICRFR